MVVQQMISMIVCTLKEVVAEVFVLLVLVILPFHPFVVFIDITLAAKTE